MQGQPATETAAATTTTTEKAREACTRVSFALQSTGANNSSDMVVGRAISKEPSIEGQNYPAPATTMRLDEEMQLGPINSRSSNNDATSLPLLDHRNNISASNNSKNNADSDPQQLGTAPNVQLKKRRIRLVMQMVYHLAIIITLLFVVVMLVLFNQRQTARPDLSQLIDTTEFVCTTPSCIRASARILNNMNENLQPCSDFYRFACGRFEDNQRIADDLSAVSTMSDIQAELHAELRALVERPAEQSEPSFMKPMRNFYASCMNLSAIEARGDAPLLAVIEELGGWPVLLAPAGGQNSSAQADGQQQQLNATSWIDLMGKLRAGGFSHRMVLDISTDYRELRIDEGGLALPDAIYYARGLNDTLVATYLNLMTESAVMLGAERKEAARQMLEVFEFERALAGMRWSDEQRRNLSLVYNRMPAGQLYELAPRIDWRRLFASLFHDKYDMDSAYVVVKAPPYLRGLNELLNRSEPRTVINYMIWRTVASNLAYMPARWRQLMQTYNEAMSGRPLERARWTQCIVSLGGLESHDNLNSFDAALSALYLKESFSGKPRAAVHSLVMHIGRQFQRMLNEIDWMDDETREEAKSKARAMYYEYGYPMELLQRELIEKYYQGVGQMDSTDALGNIRRLRVWSFEKRWNQRNRSSEVAWADRAKVAVVNAYYKFGKNAIEIPAGIMRDFFIDTERPNYLNFASIGYVVGHEITHGFDIIGRQLDKNSEYRNWWTPEADAQFKQRAQCIVDQYNNYTVTEVNQQVNGSTTLGENIADIGGIKMAYSAYKHWSSHHGREAHLPGLDYTSEQLFWIYLANTRCAKFRPEMLRLQINSDEHAPYKYRINGPLQNLPEFAKSFKCPLGSPMNPKTKCSIW